MAALGAKLDKAIQEGRQAAARQIIEEMGPDVLAKPIADKLTALHLAASWNRRETAALLLAAGADPNCRTPRGVTPLHMAAEKNAVETAELLVGAGADVQARAKDNNTAYDWARKYGASGVAKLLKEAAGSKDRTKPDLPAFKLEYVAAKHKHAPAESGECASCHNPHKSANEKLLVKPVGEVCFECHDKSDFKGKTTHSPVEGGDCVSCHDPHKSANEKLLVKPVGEVCFECHDKADVEKSSNHSAVGKESCVTCHDPHRSDSPGLIKSSAAKFTGRAAE